MLRSTNASTTDYTPAQALSVSELNGQARRLLEMNFNNIRVEGELSGLARPSSGHWYFTLKDSQAHIRCAMFRNKNQELKFIPSEGMQLIIRGRISLYEGRGDYQLIVEHMDDAGAGALQKAFEKLKHKLAEEGLFDSQRKQPLPTHPKHIGVVTSPTGAAIQDILAVLQRRFAGIPITVVPSAVQGKEAKQQLVSAIKQAEASGLFDVLIVGRGGGSLEDLWPFNEECVARTIADCSIPVVSAVGHEIDFTIADFVADFRAPTPSAAAETLSPDKDDLLARLQLLQRKMTALTRHRLELSQQQLRGVSRQLRHPGERLRENTQRLDDLELRLQQALTLKLERAGNKLSQQHDRLKHHSPNQKLKELTNKNSHLETRLHQLMQGVLERQKQALKHLSGQLNAVSPLATLSRGYSIIQKEGVVIHRSDELASGDEVSARLGQGHATLEVTSVS
ncbi:exodeoxyribonuclease VII large subunit [Endozoicomonas sp. (ex Bugula neritina AB1)]|nr:exodeoxyribonuclease VII large subunit [Endozoicomonas sp. (ex Bugula neritina AB1)]